ncbi:sugar ABC transporter ATP-binding protein [Sediminispirochaeta bajacaliforniensis]|uniref:sugar ABC transporter ATP-binding protein n=1 Tax=Sediminispirochaeta bajacaliforniensis TaxID=148 RepID=UPI00037A42D0|nr:sugar ABC transporter ATP-binding protein [Sediminispirochaeta bajacaliforniensis]
MNEVIVTMEHIDKSFPGVKALDDVSFELRSGEVMALLGENGAGKSTLMKILSGVYTRDKGDLTIFGESVGDLNPKLAKRHGVAIIHQELNMCPHLTVAENIFLGREHVVAGGILNDRDMRHQAADILGQLQIDIDPDMLVGDLAVSKQQMVEIAKALSSNARILIMDEPTSALTSKEIDDLFILIRQLRAKGHGIVYISHRLEELKHIVDRVTIMRDGKFILQSNFTDLTMDQIIGNMVGREINEQFPRIEGHKGKTIFEVRSLNAGRMVRDVSFTVNEGEIVGIAGLMGAGRTETTRAIFGIDARDSGGFILDGMPISIDSPASAIRQGVVLVPEDRKKDGLCIKLSIRENIALPNLDIICNRLGVVNRHRESEMVRQTKKSFSVRMPNADVPAASLSGGNQQKIVVGKWLARKSRIVMFDEPTRGIDVAAKVEIYNLMNELKREGIGVLFVSSEMSEIMGIADRIIVMCDGRVTGELDASEVTQEKILELATRFEDKFGEEREPA